MYVCLEHLCTDDVNPCAFPDFICCIACVTSCSVVTHIVIYLDHHLFGIGGGGVSCYGN